MTLLLVLFALSLQTSQKDNRPANGAQPASANQRGTDSLPVSVKLLNTGETKDDAKREAQRIDEERVNARKTLGLSKALVWATGITLIVLIVQSFYLRSSVIHAEKATRIELRAYVNPSGVSIQPTIAKIIFKNVGKTPAHAIRSWRHTYHGPKTKWDKEWKDKVWADEGLSLAPDGTIQHLGDVPALTPEDEAQIAAGDPAIIGAHGVVRYTDVFGDTWETEYSYFIEVLNINKSGITLTSGYNKST